MAYTLLERDQSGNVIGALRYVVSLSLVDRQIWILVGVMLLFGAAIVFFVALSSSYFISSIVNPVTEIGRAAGGSPWGNTISVLRKSMTTKSASCVILSITWRAKSLRRSG